MKFKMLSLMLLLGVALSALQSEYTIVPGNISNTLKTNVIKTKRDPGLCNCDLTSNSCNPYCCCDWDCRDQADEWRDKGWCRDELPQLALPLEPCVDVSDIREYNRDDGEFSYAGPITRLFCVAIDSYPPANTFYVALEEVPDQEV